MKECNLCFTEKQGIHCWRQVNWKGVIGWSGCHENFTDTPSYLSHIYRGGCRSPQNPSCNLRYVDVSWELRGKDDEDRR